MDAALFFLGLVFVAGGGAEWGAWFYIPGLILTALGVALFLWCVHRGESNKAIHDVGQAVLGGYAERNSLSYTEKVFDPYDYGKPGRMYRLMQWLKRTSVGTRVGRAS